MKQAILTIYLLMLFFTSYAQSTIYTNDMTYVVGDVKQAFIQDKITTEEQADFLIQGMKNLGVNGIRIPIYADGVNPNEDMYLYFYHQAIANGFLIFANPAQSSGGQRIANGILNGDVTSVLDDEDATNTLIDRIKDFASAYPCKWINPFNEDGSPDAAWSTTQMNTIYASLYGNVNGAELIGPCAWGIPASTRVLEETTIVNYITIAATHNLGFDHEDWQDFIDIADDSDIPVWDSEVNHNDKYNTGTRLEVAIAEQVDGLVMYNIWNTVDLTSGAINNSGRELMEIYLDSIPTLTSYYQIDSDNWNEGTTALVSEGSTFNLAPLPDDGSWSWTGPNNFSGDTREITISDFSSADAGAYIASYTSPQGYVNHFTLTAGLDCTSTPSITPYYRIDEVSWISNTSISIDEGQSLEIGPSTSSSVASWSWNGPNNYVSTSREITISDIYEEYSGEYQVSLIDNSGCGATKSFTVAVNDTEYTFPNEDARYYIDCPLWNVRLGADGSEDAYTCSTSTLGYHVQWTISETSTEGYYYIDCIGGSFAPRIRTDESAFADMQSRTSTGSWTKWALTQVTDSTYYITNQSSNLPRLQINSEGQVCMVSSSTEDNTVEFKFTNTEKGVAINTLVSTSIENISETTSPLNFPSLLKTSGTELKPFNAIEGITDYQLKVYSIAGKLIFISNEIETGWSPDNQENGIYIYTVSYKASGGTYVKTNGKVCCYLN